MALSISNPQEDHEAGPGRERSGGRIREASRRRSGRTGSGHRVRLPATARHRPRSPGGARRQGVKARTVPTQPAPPAGPQATVGSLVRAHEGVYGPVRPVPGEASMTGRSTEPPQEIRADPGMTPTLTDRMWPVVAGPVRSSGGTRGVLRRFPVRRRRWRASQVPPGTRLAASGGPPFGWWAWPLAARVIARRWRSPPA